MEDTLGASTASKVVSSKRSFNPCFNGRYSRSQRRVPLLDKSYPVLILVLMEDTLGDD